MANEPHSPHRTNHNYRVNFFRPRPGFMRQKVRYTWILLILWAFFTFGFQFLLVLMQDPPAGDSRITNTVIFGFPLHYWFSGQFLIVWFILLCFLFNVFVDNLNKIHRKRN